MLGYGAVAALAVREFLARTSRRRRSHRQALCSLGSGSCGAAHLELPRKCGCSLRAVCVHYALLVGSRVTREVAAAAEAEVLACA